MKAYILRVLIAFDGLIQAMFRFGNVGVTISARAGTAKNNGHRWGCLLCRCLDWLDADHCAKAIQGDIRRARQVLKELGGGVVHWSQVGTSRRTVAKGGLLQGAPGLMIRSVPPTNCPKELTVNRATYRPRIPTTAQKEAAMAFFAPSASAELPVDDLEAELLGARTPVAAAVQPTYRAVQEPSMEHNHSDDMRGQLTDHDSIRTFVEAGNATITLVSRKTGTRFTFKFTRPKVQEGDTKPRPIWVSLLNGSDNTSDYVFMGTVWVGLTGYEYRRSAKVLTKADAPSMLALLYFISALNKPALMDRLEVWHEGRCCRCGRKLTVPSSIASGIGPECATKMEVR